MRKNSRKFLIVLTAFLLIFSNLNGIIVAQAASEEVNQSFSIKVDKSEAGPGEDVLLSVTTAGQENISGIAVNYQVSSDKFIGISTKFNPTTGNFEAVIPVRDYSVAGTWEVAMVDLYYKDGTTAEVLDYEANIDGGNFTVVNESTSVQDTTKPVLNSVSVDKTEAGPGEVVKVSLDVTDDLAGISLVRVYYDGYSSKSALAFYNEQTQKYEANIEVQEYDRAGELVLTDVYMRDYAGNNITIYNDEKLTQGNFSINNENVDEAPPTIHGVTVDKKSASAGDTVTWSLDIRDDKSGVGSVSVTYENVNDQNNRQSGNAVYNEATQMYELKVPITEETMLGDWRIRYLNVGDNANNPDTIGDSTVYSWGTFDFSPGNFKVVEKGQEVIDETAPVLNGVTIDKVEAKPGEIVTVSLDVTDNASGIKYVTVTYQNEYIGSWAVDAVYNEETGKYDAVFPVDYETRTGKWTVPHIVVTDQNDNSETYWYSDNQYFDNIAFTVLNESSNDDTAPVINGMSVNKTEAQYGDEVILSLDVSDDSSGVKEVYVQYWNDYYGSSYSYAVYNQETKKYEIKFPIDYSTTTGQWRVTYISVADNQNNYAYFYEDGEVDFTNSEFTVLADNMDEEPPTLNGVSVDKDEAQPGETVTVSVDAVDTKAGIKDVYVYFDGPDGYFGLIAEYNSETGKYEVPFAVNDQTGPGKWSVYSIYLNDNVGNRTWLYNGEDYNLDITVINDNIDNTAPKVTSVTVDKNEAQPGDTVTLSIDAQDDKTGVDYVSVSIWTANKSQDYQAVYNPETGKYEVKLVFDDFSRPGTWSINNIYVQDKAYNGDYVISGEEIDFSQAEILVTNENADITPPTIHGVSVDKTEVYPGESVTVSIDASDDKSAISHLQIAYRGSNGGYEVIDADYNDETNKYEASLPITDGTIPGVWNIEYMYMEDTQENGITHYYDPIYKSGTVTVYNPNIDVAPPVITGVSVDKTEAHPGDTVTVSIDAQDDASGINELSVRLLADNRYLDEMAAVYNSETGKYEIQVTIDDQSRPGTWSIYTIYAADKEYNGYYYYNGDEYDFSTADFTVINENADVTPPTVTSVSVDKTEAQPGDTVTVSIDAEDDKSDISYIEVRYRNSYGYYEYYNAEFNSETNKYEFTIPVTNETWPGTWNIEAIYLTDSEGNSASYYHNEGYDFSGGDITIINDSIDFTAPEVTAVSVDKSEANPGDTVTLSIDAIDDKSGVEYVAVQYYTGDRYLDQQDAVYNPLTGKYEVKLSITDTSRPGEWYISSIYVRDKEYNGYRYYNEDGHDFSAATFTVFNENADMTPPTVTGVFVDKTEAQPGDTVKLSIDADDDKSDISYLEVQYRNDYYGPMYQEAVYNSETNKFEVSIPVTDETKPGQWRLYRIYIEDSQGNSDYLYYFDDIDFSNGNYTVVNENVDITAPVVNSVFVDKTDAVPGDTVKVSLNVTDDKTGVQDVYVYFTGSNGGDVQQYAEYNPETNLYEVNLPITDTTKPGQWGIYYVETTDQEYNSKYYYNDEDSDFNAADFTVINENADIKPPVVRSVSVNQTEAQPGDTVTVSIEVADDKSGTEYVDVYYADPTGREIYDSAVYNEETGKYEANIAISEDSYPGEWKLNSIFVQDHEFNYTVYHNGDEHDFSNGHFTVINDSIDFKAPEVASVSVDKTEAHPGDTVTVSIDAVDDNSGIQTVSVQYYAGNKYLEQQEAVLNPETGKYELKLPISDTSRPGVWSIFSIHVMDNDYNSDYIYGYDQDFSKGDFTVINENADMTPPTVTSVSVDKKEAVPGETVTLSLDAADDKSTITYIQVRYNNQYGGYFYQNPEWNPETNKFELDIPVTLETKQGLWSIDHIYLEDSEGNYDYIYSQEDIDLSTAGYTVINDKIEITPPTVNGVSVDMSEARPGDTVKVSVDVTDESGVASVYVDLNSDNGSWGTTAEYNPETNLYEVFLTITDDFRPGQWGIYAVEVRDNHDNEKYYYDGQDADFSAADFTVINENIDVAPPIIQGVSVDKKEAYLGDQVTVSIDAIDDKSGIQDLRVNLENSYYGSMEVEATLNEETGKYEAKLEITDSIRSGNWSINGIYVSDNNYNGAYYSDGYEGHDFSNADFTVTNANDDVTPPTLNGVSVDKQEVQAGEKVTITIDAEDDKAGIRYISVSYRLPNNSSKDASAYYNDATGKYEAVLEVGPFAKAGTWKINGIYLSDMYDNNTYIYNNNLGYYPDSEGMDLSGGDFLVNNENEDHTAPEVNSIKVNKDQFVPGETAVVELDVTDTQSGVNSISIGYSGSKGGYLYGQATYNESTQKYEAEFEIDEFVKPGVWSVSHIYVADNEGNYQNLDNREYDFSLANFTVINDQADTTPPSINSISVDKQEVTIGEEITISFDVKDEHSTVEDVWAVISNSENDPWRFAEPIFEYAIYNEETQKFEVKIPVTEGMKPGTWMVEYVSVSDTEQNWHNISLETDKDFLSTSKFTVINDQADSTVPSFNGATVDKKVVNVGEEITFSVDATDESGIKDVFIAFDGMEGAHAESVYNPDTKKYDVTIPITKDYKPGTWKVTYITIYDNAMNGIVLDGEKTDLSSLDFEVINSEYYNGLQDSINSISIDKNVAKPGEKVKLSIQFKDNSNIKDVGVRYVGGNEIDFSRQAFYNAKTGNYEVEISISPLFKPTLWSLESIYVENKDQSYLNLFEKDNELDVGDFRVSNNGLDSVAPAAPVVNKVTDKSETITGTTEAKVRVIVKTGDQELGTAVSDFEGNFSIAIDPQSGGTKLTITAIDSSDNVSEAATVTVEDLTPPEAPVVNGVGDQSTEVTGTTEAGATVTVTVGTDSYTGTADQAGNFTVTIPVQKAGTAITVTAADAAGNISGESKVTVEDKTAPSAPTVNTVTDKSGAVIGKTEPGAEVTVTIGETTYPYTASATGYFKVLIPFQKAGTIILVTAKDAAGNVSEVAKVTVEDKTAPSAPTVNTVTDKSGAVIGKTEANAAVTVKIGTTSYPYTASGTGYFKVIIPTQKAGTKITVTAADAAGNVSAATTVTVVDVTAPSVPTVNAVSDKSTSVIGKTEPYAAVTVKIGTESYPYTASGTGYFKVTIPVQKAGTIITVTAQDAAGNMSAAKKVTVLDKTAPSVPTVNTVTDKATSVIGKTEPYAAVTVKIGTTSYPYTASGTGYFKVTIPVQKAGTIISVTAKDAAGNVSAAKKVTVIDKTAPTAPTVNTVTNKSGAVIGKTEPNAAVTVKIGTTSYPTTASSTGYFKVTIPIQKAGTKITVTAKDAAGNTSAATTVYVVDNTPPAAPKVNTVTDRSGAVIGKTEAYATVTITIGTESYLGTASGTGYFKIIIPTQTAGTIITVTSTDASGNVSEATTVTVVD
jgi:phosphotransferase system HPr-like phosphotransfer protein